MKCEWHNCKELATHNEVYWGEVRSLCDEHYDLVGKDSDYDVPSNE